MPDSGVRVPVEPASSEIMKLGGLSLRLGLRF
jgi:hypothetical protein